MNAPLLRMSPAPVHVPAASDPSRPGRHTRLLHIDPRHVHVQKLGRSGFVDSLRAGDLLVVNDASTLPALLPLQGGGELRLLGRRAGGGWWAVELGAGAWRDDTDHRPAPPKRVSGAHLVLASGDRVQVVGLHPVHDRVRAIAFEGNDTAVMYRSGRAIQYSYMDRDVPLEAVQTRFAGPAVAVEMPSASRLLPWHLLDAARSKGVQVARLTHAAGLSATGDPRLDAALPLPEHFHVPEETRAAVQQARARGGRVIAVGTSVVRALEGSHHLGGVLSGVTDLRLGPHSRPALVHGVLTNVHLPGESHFELLQAFAPRPLLLHAARVSRDQGWLAHEFGDGWLILPESRPL